MQGTRNNMKNKKVTGTAKAFEVDKQHVAKQAKIAKEQPAITTQKPLGRPANGKRSNPAYKQTSMYLTKESIKRAKHHVLDTDTDLSDLVQAALDEYLNKHDK